MQREEVVKVTVKFKKSDYDTLKERVKESDTTISDYIRPIILGEIYNRSQRSTMVEQACKVMTLCNGILEDCEMSETRRRVLLKEARKIWEGLK